jgi:hypothetical protein
MKCAEMVGTMRMLPRWPRDRRSNPSIIGSTVNERISAMPHQDIKADIRVILEDPDLGNAEKIDRLERMREGARAEMRAATESAMVSDDDVGDDLKHLDEALARLSAEPVSPEDGGGATL